MQDYSTIKAFESLGRFLHQFSGEVFVPDSSLDDLNQAFKNKFEKALVEAEIKNPWFTNEFLRKSLQAKSQMLKSESLNQWVGQYEIKNRSRYKSSLVGLIMAGNIPLVGFHDFLCVIMSGHNVIAKLSSKDAVLFPILKEILVQLDSSLAKRIEFTEDQISNFNAVIATGSDNSARYFEYYFGKYPHIIRKNRNSVAVLTGEESVSSLKLLADDIFMYFGLGCRSISKIYIPEGYDITKLIDQFEIYSHLKNHNKFVNNHDYHKAIYLIEQIKFLDNDFLIIKEDISISSPVACLHYQYYKNQDSLINDLKLNAAKIQCVVSEAEFIKNRIPPGKSQFPSINDYADNMDTMKFLFNLYT